MYSILSICIQRRSTSEGKEVERKRRKMKRDVGGGNFFEWVELFLEEVEKFSAWLRNFRGVGIFSRRVEIFFGRGRDFFWRD